MLRIVSAPRAIPLLSIAAVLCMAGCPFIGQQPPVANAGGNVQTPAGAHVSLNGTGSRDANNDQMKYLWGQVAGTHVTLYNADSAIATFTAPAMAGTLVFQLTVTDTRGASARDQATITVTGG